jgi:hypothetical protein
MRLKDGSRIVAWLLILAAALIPTRGASGASPEFDRASYEAVTLDELVDTAPQITEGMDIFLKKRQLDVKLEESPKECRALIVVRVLKMQGVSEPPASSHCVLISTPRGRKMSAFVQDSLVADLTRLVKPGQSFHAYVLYFYYAGTSKNLGLLVSGFDELKSGTGDPGTGGT